MTPTLYQGQAEPTDALLEDAEALCWELRKLVRLIPAGKDCRVRFTVGVQEFDIGAEALPEGEAAHFAGLFVLALAGAFRTLPSALAASSAAPTADLRAAWQPIETAPKDGTNILLTNGTVVAQGWWEHQEPYIREHRDLEGRYIGQDESDGFDDWLDCSGGMQPDPTHWMPLPHAPGIAPPVDQTEVRSPNMTNEPLLCVTCGKTAPFSASCGLCAVAAVAAPEARIEKQEMGHQAAPGSLSAPSAVPLSEPCALDQGARPVLPLVTSNDELIVGQWYWCRYKDNPAATASPRKVCESNGVKYVDTGGCRMWSDPSNDQFLRGYEAWGPIAPPVAQPGSTK